MVKCKSLQNSKIVGSNPTLTSKLALLVLVVKRRFCNPNSGVRFTHGAPKNMEVLMLWRVHPRTVNPIPQGKHYWFDSSYFHQIYSPVAQLVVASAC